MAGSIPDELIEKFVRDSFRYSNAELAQIYQRTISTIKDWKVELRGKGYKVGRGPDPATPEPLDLGEADALILSDLHIPYVHRELFELAVKTAHAMKVSMVIIAGDLFDMSWLSPYPPDVPYHPVGHEIAVSDWYLEYLREHFDRIVGFSGNHDARFARALGATSLGVVGLSLDTWSDVRWVKLGNWMIVHPKNYSRRPGTVAREIAEVEQCNVVAGHTHLWGETITRCGRYVAIETGCLASQLPYDVMVKATNPRPVHGFTVIKEGVGYLFNQQRAEHFLKSFQTRRRK
jgi:predicted phosphodiesterase